MPSVDDVSAWHRRNLHSTSVTSSRRTLSKLIPPPPPLSICSFLSLSFTLSLIIVSSPIHLLSNSASTLFCFVCFFLLPTFGRNATASPLPPKIRRCGNVANENGKTIFFLVVRVGQTDDVLDAGQSSGSFAFFDLAASG